jgi:amidohydrolase
MEKLYAEALEMFEYTRNLRRDFHRHPELGFEEVRTAGIVARELKELGIEVTTGIAKTGVIGIIEGRKPGPVILVRVDMDALPITEETGAEYSSTNSKIMHACGHDGHTAMGITAAHLLMKHQDEIEGTVKLVFQPAEEGLGGAKLMVKEGVLNNPKPDYSIAIHLWNENPFGYVGAHSGPVFAGAESFSIKINGVGAHAAIPHLGIDPIVATSQIIIALQSVVSRNVPPLESAVLSITSIHGGIAFNIIPPNVEIKGTIRTYSKEVRDRVLKRMDAIVMGISKSMECEAEIDLREITPVVNNDEELSRIVQNVVSEMLPNEKMVEDARTMGSEDMAYMMDDIPGCYFIVGSNNSEKGLTFGHHHPKFDFDERALPKGSALLAGAAIKILKENS